jgi:surfactin synthase thioesterase subunit
MTVATQMPGVTGPQQLGPLGCLRPHGGAVARLVCFAHAGGGPGAYRKWPAALAPDIEVWTVTLPGRASRSDEVLPESWLELIEELADALDSHADGDLPALLGHSLGGVVAYEVARRLEHRGGRSPRHLFVSGCRAPHRLDGGWRLPDDDGRLVSEVDQRFGAVPSAVRGEGELLARFVPILRADLELASTYEWRPGQKVRCPVTAMAGVEDKTGPPREMRHWREHTDGDFRLATFRGSHFFIHSELRSVTRVIRRALVA